MLGLGSVAAPGCSGSDQGSTGQPSGGTGAGSGEGGSGQGGDLGIGTNSSGSGFNPDEACAAQSAEATLQKRPVDVIFMIDNSGSMTQEIVSVQNNINDNFAGILQTEGVDFRVIMVARHGNAASNQSICVSMPLSGTSCSPIPNQPVNNPPIFYHYSLAIGSHNSLCRALDSFAGGVADQFGFAPGGWSEWLRPDSLKVFVELTDDGVTCSTTRLSPNVTLNDGDNEAGGITAAAQFDAALLALSPEHFGTADNRNYVFYSIVGVSDNNPPTAPYVAADPMVTTRCNTAVAPGTGYQALSRTTGGLRFPLCQVGSYNAVFQAIAEGVIAGATLACEFPVPDAPQGETIDLKSVQVQYTPSAGDPQIYDQVDGASACTAGAFYIEADTIRLCPDACAVVQADAAAKIDVLFACAANIE
ncbi:uncharacterized protein CMC5_029560 [Chondromyces crocatus]|uniref:VWFA domain-containing protein n=2 Tax=Chondromyces crocatus TaxID=52 RepID=A0A0K1ED59_CHOCO|nr:uncharacterized protein CMC5_029560 [Chondromyces crocatus]